ncbi:stage II sporulation protein P [Candidatus Clostridium stratigraminis]|uniref:Stage II sporulation protein P n=1 Tax=Candidatus Clostridium stratigraminis TaxID=3381661 RepID=A0ABW8T7U5_9CLOT
MLKNKYTKGNICTSFALSLFLTLFMHTSLKATTGEENFQSSNPLYINILNFTMPLVKSLVSSTDTNAHLNYSLKEMLLEKAGLDINSPLSVVAREFSLIKVVDNTVAVQENNNSIIINPFKLNENNIIKISQSNSTNNTVNNIPNAAASEIYNPNIKKTLNSSKPEVFIYHTHTTESFKPSDQDNFDPNKNVVAVGDIIQNELENNYGIATIHDKTIHNAKVYNEAYARSGETVNKYLNKYKDFKLIIDLHRDASAGGSNPKPVSVTLNNKSLAKVEFVIGTANKNYQQNLSMTRKLINISQGLFPGLVRMGSPNDNGVYYIHAYFNQNKSANATLLEVGNEINTLDEAKTTGYYIARIIAEYINGKH